MQWINTFSTEAARYVKISSDDVDVCAVIDSETTIQDAINDYTRSWKSEVPYEDCAATLFVDGDPLETVDFRVSEPGHTQLRSPTMEQEQ